VSHFPPIPKQLEEIDVRMSVGDFLLKRLAELGARYLFGVPGDYNLWFLEQVERSNRIEFVGCCNELNAAYAADGSARLGGVSALVTTYGVGELSAIAGVAGAYAERVPIVCIIGAPPLGAIEERALLHHTLGDGNFVNMLSSHRDFSVAQTRIEPANARREIDRVLRSCWIEKRPVYLQLPSDVPAMTIEVPEEPLQLTAPTSDPSVLADVGTSSAGTAGLRMPNGVAVIGQPLWAAVGYALPALLGTLLAAPRRRQLLFIGDGAFQMTAQELSTILRRGLKPIIFLVNNNGYTIERLILGPGSSYNDINQWRYAEAASFFDTQDQAIAYRVRTEDELEDALAAARDREALVLIELVMSRLDAPGPLVNFAQRCAEFNFPQLATLLGHNP
jgi:TPP-dependent 2-oxoacid decarboxylase